MVFFVVQANGHLKIGGRAIAFQASELLLTLSFGICGYHFPSKNTPCRVQCLVHPFHTSSGAQSNLLIRGIIYHKILYPNIGIMEQKRKTTIIRTKLG